MSFVHLHNHSHYSLLDGLSKPVDMVKKAKELGQTAIALTDHGTMMGSVDFYNAAKAEGIKPIIGCEVYLTSGKRQEKSKDKFHLVLLVKNQKGYENLMRMVSEANISGFYGKPRIDYDLMNEFGEGLIALSACVGGEIPKAMVDAALGKITEEGYQKAKEIAVNYEKIFGKENFYLEIQHHPEVSLRSHPDYPLQDEINKALIRMAKETGIGLVCTNDSHYVNLEDNIIQDALLCINTGKLLEEQKGRMCMMDGDFSILPTEKMEEYFKDVPEALQNTVKIADMVDFDIEFDRDLVPVFDCPGGISEKEYLQQLSDIGLKDRYGIEKREDGTYFLPESIDPAILPKPLDELIERMDFELLTINRMGYPGYFLIVADFVNWAKNNGCLVGPGRGSAAGALVTYLVKITDVDPLAYDLLFERFLNPDRISMPDIDIDFQDDGREKVLGYVRRKYGESNVCQVVTYQTMAAKNSIKDIGRVKNIPLSDVNKVAATVPSKPGTSLKKMFKDQKNPEYKDFFQLYKENEVNKDLIDMAVRIEGTIRGTGTHACAVIISGEPVYNFCPQMYPPKDNSSIISQYEGPQLEAIGLLKMDFLGLRNLSIIGNCLTDIKKNHGVDIDINNIPLDDLKTFELYSEGLTHGIFQFESAGMKKYLRELKPDRFEDLVAMNALYRPGPMKYIPNFIARKHGREEVVFDHPIMEDYLDDTYGITVYQEQVMLQSRALGGFTRGQSDSLRKAMGKKKKKLMDELKVLFTKGCHDNELFVKGAEEKGKTVDELVEKIWADWEDFAQYAFNKSHSVCYAYVSYQTAYLKANYPVEYMAAMLNSVRQNTEKVLEYIGECEKLGIEIIRPDVNRSFMLFSATKDGKIAFGLSAIKNVGEKALDSIIEIRERDGEYHDFYDFLERIDLSKANKRTLEFLGRAGAFDSFGNSRAQLVASLDDFVPHFQKVFAKKDEWENSLFGDMGQEEAKIEHPSLPNVPEWDKMTMLEEEMEFLGFYVSGHPLDDYKDVINAFSIKKKVSREIFRDGQSVRIGGLISGVKNIVTKKGNAMASLSIMTLYGNESLVVFPRDYEKLKEKIKENEIFIIDVKIQFRGDDDISLIVGEMLEIEEARKKLHSSARRIRVNMKPSEIDEITQRQLVEYLQKNPGDKELLFCISGAKKEYILKPAEYRVSGNSNFLRGMKELLGEGNVVVDL